MLELQLGLTKESVRVEQEIVADGSEMIEFICDENQKFLKLTGREP